MSSPISAIAVAIRERKQEIEDNELEGSVVDEGKKRREGEWQTRQPKPKVEVLDSPLYRMIARLRLDDSSGILQGLTIRELGGGPGALLGSRVAFIMYINSASYDHLFAPYRLGVEEGDRHFSIDQNYRLSKARHGRTGLHYTERYRLPEAEDTTITVHAYLDEYGNYQYTQIKQKNEEGEFEMEISPALEQRVLANANAAITMLDRIFEARREGYRQAKIKVDALEGVASITNHQMQSGAFNLKRYRGQARLFIEAINELNEYSTQQDCRGRRMEAMLKGIEEWVARLEQVTKVEVGAKVSQKEGDAFEVGALEDELTASAVVSSSKSRDHVYQSAINELEALNKELKPIKAFGGVVSKIKEMDDKVKKANVLLIVLFSLPKHLETPDVKKLMAEILKKTSKNSKEGVDFLKKKALEGDLKAAQELFVLFEDNLRQDFYQDLIKEVINKLEAEQGQSLSNLRDIFEFFKEKSVLYLEAVRSISKKEKFSLSKGFVKKMSIKTNGEVSLLFKLYCHDKPEWFEMFLRHGVDPNGWSFISDDPEIPIMTILRAIATSEAEVDDPKYIQTLLCHKANPKEIVSKDFNEEKVGALTSKEKLARKLERNRQQRQPGVRKNGLVIKPGDFYKYIDVSTPTIIFPFVYNNASIFSVLLPHVLPEDLAYSFSSLIRDNSFMQFSCLFSDSSFLKFLDNREARLPFIKEDGHFLSFVFFKKTEFPPGAERKRNNQFNMFKKLYEAFSVKLNLMSLEEFSKIYDRIFQLAKDFSGIPGFRQSNFSIPSSVRRNRAIDLFYACLYLLIEKSNSLPRIHDEFIDKVNFFERYNLPKLIDRLVQADPSGDLITPCKAWKKRLEKAIKDLPKSYVQQQELSNYLSVIEELNRSVGLSDDEGYYCLLELSKIGCSTKKIVELWTASNKEPYVFLKMLTEYLGSDKQLGLTQQPLAVEIMSSMLSLLLEKFAKMAAEAHAVQPVPPLQATPFVPMYSASCEAELPRYSVQPLRWVGSLPAGKRVVDIIKAAASVPVPAPAATPALEPTTVPVRVNFPGGK